MIQAASENEQKAIGRKRRRWLRVPSFRIAWLVSALVLLALIGWGFADASLRDAFDTSLMLIRVQPNPGYDLKRRLASDQLRLRITLLAAFSVLGIVANVVVALRLIVGRRGGRSILAYLAAMALAGAWLSFFSRYYELEWRGFTFRLARRAPELKLLFEHLRDQWPMEDGTMPVVGNYRVVPKRVNNPDALYLTDAHSSFPFVEALGPSVQRRSSGIIEIELRFSIEDVRTGTDSDVCLIEYAPASRPADFTQGWGHAKARYTLRGSKRLGDSVYLAWYDRLWPIKDDGHDLPRSSASP